MKGGRASHKRVGRRCSSRPALVSEARRVPDTKRLCCVAGVGWLANPPLPCRCLWPWCPSSTATGCGSRAWQAPSAGRVRRTSHALNAVTGTHLLLLMACTCSCTCGYTCNWACAGGGMCAWVCANVPVYVAARRRSRHTCCRPPCLVPPPPLLPRCAALPQATACTLSAMPRCVRPTRR